MEKDNFTNKIVYIYTYIYIYRTMRGKNSKKECKHKKI
jgi:hypothetical protein